MRRARSCPVAAALPSRDSEGLRGAPLADRPTPGASALVTEHLGQGLGQAPEPDLEYPDSKGWTGCSGQPEPAPNTVAAREDAASPAVLERRA